MKRREKKIIFLMVAAVLMYAPMAGASVILNEIFADPPAGIVGDANRDGLRSSTQDEFIEVLNFGGEDADISSWSLWDSVAVRHIFPSNTILGPYAFLAVFGGGAPSLSGINWQVASKGSLGLNNGGDTVTLYNANAQIIDQVVYGGIADNDQSITRFPDGKGTAFVLHSNLEQAQGALFSPGTSIDAQPLFVAVPSEEEPLNNPIVPEMPTFLEQTQGALFSPETSIDAQPLFVAVPSEEGPLNSPIVPELSTFLYFGIGLGLAFFRVQLSPKICKPF